MLDFDEMQEFVCNGLANISVDAEQDAEYRIRSLELLAIISGLISAEEEKS